MNASGIRGNGTTTFFSTDVDEARSIGGDLYYPHEIRVLGDESRFQMRVTAASVGPVTIGRLDYSTEVEIYTNELGAAYQVNIPMRGDLTTGSGRLRTVANPHRGAVYRCDQRTLLRGWDSPYPTPVLAMKFDRQALEAQLSDRLGIEVNEPIVFEMDLDLDSVVGRQWLSLVEGISHQLDSPEVLALAPIVAAPMAEVMMSGLLVAADHDYRTRLYEPPRALPSVVRMAVEYMHANASEPITVAHVARSVGVSVRTLQVSFREALGLTPMRKLKLIRLEHVRKELLAADPREEGVTDVARRWGFLHVGRFAGDYRVVYGTSPSEDLRTVPFRR